MSESIRRGQQARDARQWAEAEAAYRSALSAREAARMTEVKRSEVIGELGLCELALQKSRDAAEHLAESLQQRAALSLSLQHRFEDGQRSAEAHVMRLYLGVSPADAKVLLDGKPLERQAASYELFLTPGEHTVRARLLGYGDAVTTFTGAAGDEHRLVLRLPRVPEVPTASAAAATAPPKPEGPASSSAAAKLRMGGVILTATTAVIGGAALGWAGVIDGEIADHRAERRQQGWAWSACSQPDASTECSDMDGDKQRRDLLAGIGITSMAASGTIGVVTLASYVLARGQPTSDGGMKGVPVAGPGRQARLTVSGVW